MALDIDLRHTAVLSMDFENDIVHPEGALKEFGFAKMVADNSVLEKTGQLHPLGGTPQRRSAIGRHLGGTDPRPRGMSASTASNLDQILRTNCIGTLLLAGVATSFVVESTARQACNLGYNTVVVGDCCTSMNQEAHDSSLTTALPFICTISSLEEVMNGLSVPA